MNLLRKLAFWSAWVCLILGHRLADLARDGIGEADENPYRRVMDRGAELDGEYKVGGTSSDDP